MFFKIDKKLLNVGGGIYTGVVYATGLNNEKEIPEINALLESEIRRVKETLTNDDVSNEPGLGLYRSAMKELGINPSKYPCSIDAIIKRIIKTGEFVSISPVVNLGNYISLKYRIPVGVHDVESLNGELCVRPATLEDCAIDDNSMEKDALSEGEPVYVTGNSVRTRRWFWRQMPAGRVTEKSNSFIFPIDGFLSNKDTIENALNELCELISKFFGETTTSGVICSENTEFCFGNLSEEEQEIENQISIMLKGVAQYTTISDIRKKIADAKKEGRPLRVKLGLDPSAPDIHIGHAVVLRKIRQLQELGHTAVIIIGDYTGMIGDPTGKSKTRKALSREEVEKNAQTYMDQIFKIIDKEKTEVHYNSEWLSKMNFGDVIELSAKCTVARMLERDDFNNRYTNHLPLSVHEFFYPLMQAYDSVAIKADIELGGTDQTFNILMGRNIQRDYGQEPQLTLFMPLLEGIDGIEKMSKSLGNYVGISEDPTVVYEKIMKIPDDKIIKYFDLCTDLHPSEIEKYKKDLSSGVNPRDVKMQLAYEITKLYSDEAKANEAQERFKSVFQQGVIPEDVQEITVDSSNTMSLGEQIVSSLVALGMFKSKSEIRRIFSQGGAAINGERVTDPNSIGSVNTGDALKVGKNNFFRIKVL